MTYAAQQNSWKSKASIGHQAKKFALWRAASSLNWECSIADAARVAGMDPQAAIKISYTYGWGHRFSDEERRKAQTYGMKRGQHRIGNSVDPNSLDLTDLMR